MFFWVILGVYQVLLSFIVFTDLDRVLVDFTGFYRVLLGFAWFDAMIELGFTGFYCGFLSFTRSYSVL